MVIGWSRGALNAPGARVSIRFFRTIVMTEHESAWLAHQRARWMRPDAERWIRPDAARFLKPGIKLADAFPTLVRKYRPDQPRIPAGQPGGGRWTDDWGSAPAALSDLIKPIPAATADDLANLREVGGGRRGGGSVGDVFPGASARQQSLLDQAMARSSSALAQIRQYDPDWKPRESNLTRPGSIDGAIAEAEARARESEAHLDRLRSGIGGNLGPPLDPPRESLPSMRPFDGQGWINAYRTIYNEPNLFGEPMWRPDNGTVAAAEIDGKLYFGVNSGSPGYGEADRFEADGWRWSLVNKYPDIMRTDNIGQRPNDALYHAEATILMRAARDQSSLLADRSIDIQVDREICNSCKAVLPKLALELGNPYVRYIEVDTGMTSVMRNGSWLLWRQK
ncbi:hypothetical protein [Nitrobacter sp. 62-23]|uniref:hypothetical protein n=3 Tax=unclassified Nitrobacter TaxID=2620411 RepID=UPI0025D71AA5|nr:hypothetical protein [Nitrobacter sp. 62-23]